MMGLTFGLFTAVSDLGPHGPLVTKELIISKISIEGLNIETEKCTICSDFSVLIFYCIIQMSTQNGPCNLLSPRIFKAGRIAKVTRCFRFALTPRIYKATTSL